MLIYIARQPIFDQLKDVVAYELLYRDPETQTAYIKDANAATNSVLMASTLVASFEKLVEGKRAYINFTKDLINDGTPLLFSKDYMTIEILEDIVPDAGFMQKLLNLKDKGYTLALDDFTLHYPYTEIINLVDIIKVDFLLTISSDQIEIIKKFNRPGLKFLAEKVETAKEFERAKSMGYDYFQGYYFSKPCIFKYKDINSLVSSHFEIIRALDSHNPTYTKLVSIFEKDVSLTYKLFKFANSPIYGGIEQINTVRQALVRLGFSNIRKWMYLIILRSMYTGQSDELVSVCLQRAKMLEIIAPYCGFSDRASECFLIGLFSMLDVLTDKNIVDVLEDLPLSIETKEAIINKENTLGRPLKLAIAYEKGDWSEVERLCRLLKLNPSNITTAYMESAQWASEIIQFTF
ncbi:EAL and HDOD domain-containing protein [Aminipila sp.]|uniref:EAL and HDOD domain-containing protein n=2 Tax=Aminipila sp. TaxID=2060095 RepID=UPI0028A1CD76|nr:HDOD domain-containing protein [Aminipila sp.]